MATPEEDEDGFARKLEMHTLAKSYEKLIAEEDRDRSTDGAERAQILRDTVKAIREIYL
jgi:hypothetical protein